MGGSMRGVWDPRGAAGLVAIVLGVLSGCDKTAERACENAKCPLGTAIDLSAESRNACGGGGSYGSKGVSIEVECVTQGACTYACRLLQPCCGELKLTATEYSCSRTCAGSDADGGAGTSGGSSPGAGGSPGDGGSGAGSAGPVTSACLKSYGADKAGCAHCCLETARANAAPWTDAQTCLCGAAGCGLKCGSSLCGSPATTTVAGDACDGCLGTALGGACNEAWRLACANHPVPSQPTFAADIVECFRACAK